MDCSFSLDRYFCDLWRTGFLGRTAMADGALIPRCPLFGNRVFVCGASGWPGTNDRGPRFRYFFSCWGFALRGVTCFFLPQADREIRGRDASETLGRPTLAGTARPRRESASRVDDTDMVPSGTRCSRSAFGLSGQKNDLVLDLPAFPRQNKCKG